MNGDLANAKAPWCNPAGQVSALHKNANQPPDVSVVAGAANVSYPKDPSARQDCTCHKSQRLLEVAAVAYYTRIRLLDKSRECI